MRPNQLDNLRLSFRDLDLLYLQLFSFGPTKWPGTKKEPIDSNFEPFQRVAINGLVFLRPALPKSDPKKVDWRDGSFCGKKSHEVAGC